MTSEAQTTNPYHEARSIWNERYQNLVRARWNWQLIALVLALSNVIFALALVWHSAQSKVVPYIVRVDEAGQSLVIGPATASTIADPKITISALNEHFRTADPFLAARSGTVMPSVRNTLQLGDRTWQVEWVET
ncbi:MAG: VirB8/TrbF family protein, partial [Myxococcota bacterium]